MILVRGDSRGLWGVVLFCQLIVVDCRVGYRSGR